MEHRIKHKSGTLTECNVDCRWTNRGIAIEDRKGFFGGGLSGKLLRWPWASLPVATTWYLKIIHVEKSSVSLNHAFRHERNRSKRTGVGTTGGAADDGIKNERLGWNAAV